MSQTGFEQQNAGPNFFDGILTKDVINRRFAIQHSLAYFYQTPEAQDALM